MKKQLLLFYFLLFVSLIAQAQLRGNGYYRIKNRDTERYLTIVDNKASVNIATTEPDLAAILPIRNFDRIVGNPGSIIYIEDAGSGNYILSGQNVNTYNLVGEYLKLRVNKDYQDTLAFRKKCFLNTANAGKFSSDRTIRDYVEEVWML